MSEVIKEPTYILDNKNSIIYVIFTSQPNMVMGSGVHPSLHSNCHHQILYPKFDLKAFYPPLYENSRADFNHLKRAIGLFDWESLPNNLIVN